MVTLNCTVPRSGRNETGKVKRGKIGLLLFFLFLSLLSAVNFFENIFQLSEDFPSCHFSDTQNTRLLSTICNSHNYIGKVTKALVPALGLLHHTSVHSIERTKAKENYNSHFVLVHLCNQLT